MATIQAPLYSASGDAKGQMDLPEAIFGGEGSLRSLQQVIVGLQANQRQGTSSTKTRGVVSGGGRKPWKQKGTGNARSGSIRSPLWRKGGIIFGPLPRSYRAGLDQARRLLALKTAFAEKAKSSDLGIFEAFQVTEPKTRDAQAVLEKAGITGKRTLFVVDKREAKLERAFANIPNVRIVEAAEVNAWTLMGSRKIFMTKAALDVLEKRWPKG
jgi:large subunit ribosomal protein L4